MVDSVKDYLAKLADGGYNIIYSVPVRIQRGPNVSFAYTDVKYQVVTKDTITVQNALASRTVFESPVILICGMLNYRAMPATNVPWYDNWVIHSRKNKTFGSVYLSKEAFLESRLLPLLERINQKTTLLPQFTGIINDEWFFDVSNWEQDTYRSKQRCTWVKDAQSSNENYLEYTWNHNGELSQREKGTIGFEKNAESTLSCKPSWRAVCVLLY